jgi:hypothetical protein
VTLVGNPRVDSLHVYPYTLPPSITSLTVDSIHTHYIFREGCFDLQQMQTLKIDFFDLNSIHVRQNMKVTHLQVSLRLCENYYLTTQTLSGIPLLTSFTINGYGKHKLFIDHQFEWPDVLTTVELNNLTLSCHSQQNLKSANMAAKDRICFLMDGVTPPYDVITQRQQ